MKAQISNIYTNRLQNHLMVKLKRAFPGIMNVKLLEVNSKELKSVYSNYDQARLKLEGVPNGFYFVQVTNGSQQTEIHNIMINN